MFSLFANADVALDVLRACFTTPLSRLLASSEVVSEEAARFWFYWGYIGSSTLATFDY